MTDTADDIGDDETEHHEDGDGRDDINACLQKLGRIDIGKRKLE